jgi:penicillin-binding protein 1A
MLKANHRYNPRYNPENAKNRRNTVLGQMKKYGYLTKDSLELVKALPIKLDYRPTSSQGIAPYFKTELGEYLKKWCGERGLNLYRSGLKIYTTINSEMQKEAEKAVQMHLTEFQQKFDKSWGKEKPWRYITDRKVIPDFIETHMRRTERYQALKE